MLSEPDNILLTRTGPSTPMGQLFRHFWQPVLLSAELPEPDDAPVRITILGEDLRAFLSQRRRVGRSGVAALPAPRRRSVLRPQ